MQASHEQHTGRNHGFAMTQQKKFAASRSAAG
jgi:hypothetical protein